MTRRRIYYETMEAVLARADKTIVEPNGGRLYTSDAADELTAASPGAMPLLINTIPRIADISMIYNNRSVIETPQ